MKSGPFAKRDARIRNVETSPARPMLTPESIVTPSVSPYQRIPVDARPATVVAALRESIAALGLTEYAVVDHGHDMAAAGAAGLAAWTLVFGNPAAGAKLLARDLAAAIDIPLRLAVIAAGDAGSEIVLRDMRTLLADDLTELADGLTAVLRKLADAAASAAAQRRGTTSATPTGPTTNG
jgi:uncharacterized protein (DUF302 family)